MKRKGEETKKFVELSLDSFLASVSLSRLSLQRGRRKSPLFLLSPSDGPLSRFSQAFAHLSRRASQVQRSSRRRRRGRRTREKRETPCRPTALPLPQFPRPRPSRSPRPRPSPWVSACSRSTGHEGPRLPLPQQQRQERGEKGIGVFCHWRRTKKLSAQRLSLSLPHTPTAHSRRP